MNGSPNLPPIPLAFESKPSGHHANDCVPLTVQQDVLTQDGWIAAIHLPPGGIAQYNSVCILAVGERRYIFVEAVAQLWSNAQSVEEVRAHAVKKYFDGSSVAFEKVTPAGDCVVCNLLQCLALLLPLSEIKVGAAPIDIRVAADGRFVNDHQALGMVVGQWPEKNLINHGEHGSRRCDAEHQRCDHRGREPRGSPHRAHGLLNLSRQHSSQD